MSPIWMNRLKTLSLFFLSNVLLKWLDMLTDLHVAFQLVTTNDHSLMEVYGARFRAQLSERLHMTGYLVLMFVCLPFFAQTLRRLFIQRSMFKCGKGSYTQFKNFLWDVFWDVPGLNLLRRLALFFQLFFMDTNNPSNFLLIDKLNREVTMSNIYESVLESGPQLVIQTLLYYDRFLYGVNISLSWDLVNPFAKCSTISLILSLTSLSLASTRLFFYQRVGVYSEALPSVKMILVVWPILALSTLAVTSLWVFHAYCLLMRTPILLIASIGVFGCVFLILRMCNPHDFRSHGIITGIFVSWLSPYTVLVNSPLNHSYFLLLLSLVTFITHCLYSLVNMYFDCPSVFVDGTYDLNRFKKYAVPPLVCFFVYSIILQMLGNYHNLYKLSKPFACCCISPMVHRSMVYDYFVQPTLFEQNPDFFKYLIKDTNLMNFPDLEGDTVLHYAMQTKRYSDLAKMISSGGNPFLRNKKRETVEMLIKQLNTKEGFVSQAEIDELDCLIIEARRKLDGINTETRVHRAARNNCLAKVKFYRILGASFEHYNSKNETPLEVAFQSDNLEVALYMMHHSKNVFEDPNEAPKAFGFILQSLLDQRVDNALVNQYRCVFESFICYSMNNSVILEQCLEKYPSLYKLYLDYQSDASCDCN